MITLLADETPAGPYVVIRAVRLGVIRLPWSVAARPGDRFLGALEPEHVGAPGRAS